jgi:crossover junction endodeoxyribonuclease RuvC
MNLDLAPFSRLPSDHIIIGLDPGLALVGYAILRDREQALSLEACSVIRTQATMPLAQRFQRIYQAIEQLLAHYRPDEAAIEGLFWGTNVTTALQVGGARGVIFLALANAGLLINEYNPTQVKAQVGGSGRATKQQVGLAVQQRFHLPAVPRPDDAADAAAVGLCHSILSNSYLASVCPPGVEDTASPRQ